jgi:hypothetical protein
MGRGLVFIAMLLAAGAVGADGPELRVDFARSTEAKETDILRLSYRSSLPVREDWWMPTQLQLGASIWRVPDLGGTTRRFDLNLTPVWRGERSWGYVEGGVGVYLLSKTINNDANHLPSSFQFGSHLGAGLRLGERGQGRVGVGLQHLSNAGLKQPNGGINLFLVSASFAF